MRVFCGNCGVSLPKSPGQAWPCEHCGVHGKFVTLPDDPMPDTPPWTTPLDVPHASRQGKMRIFCKYCGFEHVEPTVEWSIDTWACFNCTKTELVAVPRFVGKPPQPSKGFRIFMCVFSTFMGAIAGATFGGVPGACLGALLALALSWVV